MKTLNTLIKELQSLVNIDEAIGELPVYVSESTQRFVSDVEVNLEYTFENYEMSLGYDEIVDLEEIEWNEMKDVKAFVTIGD